ncbi:MAG TPA: PAAR domain-containing protein [Bryobacteraceae bacterium]|jgi:uncharacterized Zn-binding protein involved in type VI secretion|nr:PAAR domain-containing protein [Bryobacteraceae bacterium]
MWYPTQDKPFAMQPQTRVGDRSQVPADAHGKICCPHNATGPGIQGSPDVLVNNQPALRQFDPGIHSACCGPNTWIAIEGCEQVLINNLPAHRRFDLDQHCGGMGFMIEGSPDVYVGDGTESGMSQAKQNAKALCQICGGG